MPSAKNKQNPPKKDMYMYMYMQFHLHTLTSELWVCTVQYAPIQ